MAEMELFPTKTFDELELLRETIDPKEHRSCRHRIDVPIKGQPYGFCGRKAVTGLWCCKHHLKVWYSNWPEVISQAKAKQRELETA